MLLAVAVQLALVAYVGANVIGIDFGSDNMKVGLVSPGKFDIVVNGQSKRRTPQAVTFYNGERSYGADAFALMSRKPDLTFTKFHRMIGKTASHPLIDSIRSQYFPYEIYANESTGITALRQGDTYYYPEELLAMMMSQAKAMTKDYSGQGVKDCVLTVPSYFTQHERSALYSAADIADLNVLSLIEENTAAALQFGIDRVFDEPHNVLIFNMGASMIQVTIVTYSSYPSKDGGKNKTVGQFQVVGKAWDTQTGGFNFDLRIAEILADRFNSNWHKKKNGAGQDVRQHVRPMTRLRMESTKIREVLSANNEYPYKVDGLHADVDLNTKITRAEFEEAAADLFARVTVPIDEALKMAGMTLENINAVELIGGGIRMPKVKENLEAYFKAGDLELGNHLNGDEAMALGAAFRAANISTAFRVRKIGVSDVAKYGVSVQFETLPTEEIGGLFSRMKSLLGGSKKKDEEDVDEGAEVWSKHTALYPAGSAVPSRTKAVAFHHDKDILCRVEYDVDETNPLPAGTHHVIGVYNITGVAEFAKETETKGLGQPKVHLSFTLDASGMILLAKAEATVDLPVEAPLDGDLSGISPKSENATNAENREGQTEGSDVNSSGGGESDEKNAAEEEQSETTEGNATEGEYNNGDNKTKEEKKNEKKGKKDKKNKKEKYDTMLRKTLTVRTNFDSVLPPQWSPTMLKAARAKLEALDANDNAIRVKAAALNDLEAYVYMIRNRLRDEDGDDQLGAVSTSEQRDEIIETCNEIEEWLYDEGRDAEVAVYKSKQAGIKVKAESIFKRFKEHTARPKAVEKAKHQLHSVMVLLQEWNTTMPQITEEEKQKVLEIVDKIQAWLDDNIEAQSKLTPFETAAFAAADVIAQLKPLTAQMEKLLKKPKLELKKDSKDMNTDEDPTVHINLDENTSGRTEEKSSDESEEASAEEPMTETAKDEL